MKINDFEFWLVTGGLSVIVLGGGGAWATSINSKVEKIAGMEVNIQYMQRDISDIKEMIENYVGK